MHLSECICLRPLRLLSVLPPMQVPQADWLVVTNADAPPKLDSRHIMSALAVLPAQPGRAPGQVRQLAAAERADKDSGIVWNKDP